MEVAGRYFGRENAAPAVPHLSPQSDVTCLVPESVVEWRTAQTCSKVPLTKFINAAAVTILFGAFFSFPSSSSFSVAPLFPAWNLSEPLEG